MQTFKNPILPGFYPDPSICRVGDDYYLVTSTFTYFPGVPIFHSKDLVYWTQIGNVLTRPEQAKLQGEVSRGIFAPTIRYHDGVFYMITTNVNGGGNFLVTATDPAGPWSDPHFLEGAEGIDPSLFFDDDGKCYYHGTRDRREGAAFYGDNEIYLQQLDLKKMKLVGERYAIWHSALKNAVWPEGPHVYKVGEYYYLMISEGGTGPDHAITVARSKTLTGYYEGFKSNPILTHRHLGHKYPIVNVGHGDLVETPSGEWWMVCLASRPYGGYFRNLGRETFLVPVTWENGWPVVNYGIGLVRDEERYPNLAPAPIIDSTSFDFREVEASDAFQFADFPKNILFLRNPVLADYKLDKGLHLRLNKNPITQVDEPVSYAAVRQQHMDFECSTFMDFTPKNKNQCAGLVIFQNHKFNYQFVLTKKGKTNVLQVIKCENSELTTLAEVECNDMPVCLRIAARGQSLSFYYCHSNPCENCTPVYENADASMLSTDVAGGFVGTTIGVYANSDGKESKDFAQFDTLVYEGK